MNYYGAPLEGSITGAIYISRNALCRNVLEELTNILHHLYPQSKENLPHTEHNNDVLPEHNRGMRVVPQILKPINLNCLLKRQNI